MLSESEIRGISRAVEPLFGTTGARTPPGQA